MQRGDEGEQEGGQEIGNEDVQRKPSTGFGTITMTNSRSMAPRPRQTSINMTKLTTAGPARLEKDRM